ncbi:hypothetical protein KM043_018554 [Ampulex compressa]|nr:hypothetical protein KM043_018554 [Ampulex compressa]
MITIMECLRILENFQLSDLNEEWINSIWDADLVMHDEPPDEYLAILQSKDIRLLLRESCAIVKDWLAKAEMSTQDLEVSWHTLIVLNINIRALLPVLAYIIENGQHKDTDENSQGSCFAATSLYFVLLAIPGSNAFNVFHPGLYQRAIDTLKMVRYICPDTQRCNEAKDISNRRIVNCELQNSRNALFVECLHSVLHDFLLMLKSFLFKNHTQQLEITVCRLHEIATCEIDVVEFGISLSRDAYTALESLCDKKHGSVEATIVLIAKYALPCFLSQHTESRAKPLTRLRERTIDFLRRVSDEHKEGAQTGLSMLMQQLIIHCPERLDARQRQAAILLKVLIICKDNVVINSIYDIVLASYHARASCRIFAQEIIGKLLAEPFLMGFKLREDLKLRVRKLLIAAMLNRCTDYSGVIRGRAMAMLTEFTESISNKEETIIKTLFDPVNINKRFLTFKELTDALNTNIDPLPGSKALLDMLMERTEDERALVRRSALQTLKNLAVMFPRLIEKMLTVIDRRCRDPCVTVRRCAVQVSSEILAQFPQDSLLIHEWVQAVVPQIFDVEIKVQEKVLEFLQKLLLNRVKNAAEHSDNALNDLPWKILNKLISLKMRKHLSKACRMWVENGTITKVTIRNIQSHIGTNNDVAAWAFLAALSENMTLENLDEYIGNYREILGHNDFRASLILKVIRQSWPSFDERMIKCLHTHLYECLGQFRVHFALIGICLDIVHQISQRLQLGAQPCSFITGMSSLMKLSEAEMENAIKHDCEDVEMASNFLKATLTLGHAAFLCTGKISAATLRILQGALLEWDSLPEPIKRVKELRASAIAILGQQAMRDREIAQEVVPIFGRLMRQEIATDLTTQIAVKINSAKVLADICVRFTALVEPYLPHMCVSMKDSSPAVREAIMVIFIELLLEDYVKVKGPFFFHILTMLSDPDDTIRELAVFLIEERLLARNKMLISQRFLESIYHYNGYESEHRFSEHKMRERERKVLTLPGRINQERRRAIYDFMLEHSDPPGKLKLLVRLTGQIIAGASMGTIDVEKEEGACVLKDALYIINHDSLHLSSSLSKYADDSQEQEESPSEPKASIGGGAVNVIMDGMKRHGLDVLLPQLAKLKKRLSILRSPTEAEVTRLLVKTYSGYSKEQLTNMVNEYPEFERELCNYRRELTEERCSRNENCRQECAHRLTTSEECSLPRHLSPLVVLERLSAIQIASWRCPTNEGTATSSEHASALVRGSNARRISLYLNGPGYAPKISNRTGSKIMPGRSNKDT